MSPVRTATRSPGAKLSNVLSSRLVLPEPGELIRFRQRTSCSAKRARSSAAIRSFSFRIFPSSGIRFVIVSLRVSKTRLIPPGDYQRPAASGTGGFQTPGRRALPAQLALITPRAVLDLKRKRGVLSPLDQGIETKTQRLRVNAREFTDSNPDLADSRPGCPPRMLERGFQDRIGNPHFVHGARQQIRGNWSPASMSTMRVVPRLVRRVTTPGWDWVT